MKNATAAILIATALLAGCTASTGPLPAGPNTYVLTGRAAPIIGGSDEAQRLALAEANTFCRSQGREMLPMESRQERGVMNPRMTGFTTTFRCLLPSDPEFQR